jgi:hypothetical protein
MNTIFKSHRGYTMLDDGCFKGLGIRQKEILKFMAIDSAFIVETLDVSDASFSFVLQDIDGNDHMDLTYQQFESLKNRDIFDSFNVTKSVHLIQTQFQLKADIRWKAACI